jgi:hypothetical protein
MPRFAIRPALALLGTLLCLAACTPTAPPARVPAGWKVLATPHFRLAYPPDWRTFSMYEPSQEEGIDLTGYYIATPDPGGHVQLGVSALAKADVSGSCRAPNPLTQPAQQTTLAGLPMYYRLILYPQGGGALRLWGFTNAQRTAYTLSAIDGDASAATQAQDDVILATPRSAPTTSPRGSAESQRPKEPGL